MCEVVTAVTQEHGEIIATRPTPRRVGPGAPPSPRDEPVAYAIWCALARVHSASGWDDVARQVEYELRRQGIVTPANDEVIRLRRELETEQRTTSALRAQWRAREAREAARAR